MLGGETAAMSQDGADFNIFLQRTSLPHANTPLPGTLPSALCRAQPQPLCEASRRPMAALRRSHEDAAGADRMFASMDASAEPMSQTPDGSHLTMRSSSESDGAHPIRTSINTRWIMTSITVAGQLSLQPSHAAAHVTMPLLGR